MKMLYELLALDVDGTLMNSQNELPDANRAALHRAHDAGLKISLCTGRALSETRSVLHAIGLDLDAGVFVFGAIISELPAGRTIARSELSPELTGRLIEFFQSRGFPLLLLFDPAQVSHEYQLLHGRRNAEAYENWVRFTPTKLERVSTWRPDGPPPVRIGVIEDPAHIASTIGDLETAFPAGEIKFNAIYAPNYKLHVVECFAPQVNKWHGLEQLCQLLDIAPARVVTLGDDVNDVEMIARAGLGVAMGNAVEPVRDVARLHVASNNDCGVAELIDRLLAGRVPSPSLHQPCPPA